MQDIAREMEHSNPGIIHEVKLVFTGRRLHASIVFDRHRGTGTCDGAAQRDSRADGAPAPQGGWGRVGRGAGQSTPQLPSSRAREHKGPLRPVQSARLGAAQPKARPDRASPPAGRDRPTSVADITKEDVIIVERTIKAAITPIVRELGGDEQNGVQYLSPPFKLALGRHKSGPIRVPLGSPAHQVAPNTCATFVADTVLSLYLNRSKTAREIEITLKKIFTPTVHDTVMTEGAATPATTTPTVPTASFSELMEKKKRMARPTGGS